MKVSAILFELIPESIKVAFEQIVLLFLLEETLTTVFFETRLAKIGTGLVLNQYFGFLETRVESWMSLVLTQLIVSFHHASFDLEDIF